MRTIFISGLLLAAAIAFGACGSDEDSGEGPHVVATTGIVAELAEKVAGPGLEVEQVIPDGSSPHDFQLSAEDRQTLERADLLVASGAGLEAGIPLDDLDAPDWVLIEHASDVLPFEEAGAHADADESADEDGVDPHVWMDPSRVADALPSLAEALAEVDPAEATAYRQRARDYARELRHLDAELERTLASIPAHDRDLITSHDSLGYLADRYGLRVVATAFPASGPEAEASAARIRDVERAVRDCDAPAVFAQEEDDPKTLQLIADATGVEIEDGLIIESPGSAGSYEEMLRRDAELIAAALSD